MTPMMESAVPMADVELTDYLSSRRSNNLRISQHLLNFSEGYRDLWREDPMRRSEPPHRERVGGLVTGLLRTAGETRREWDVRGGHRGSHEGNGEDGECDKAFHCFYWLLCFLEINLSRKLRADSASVSCRSAQDRRGSTSGMGRPRRSLWIP